MMWWILGGLAFLIIGIGLGFLIGAWYIFKDLDDLFKFFTNLNR